MKKKMKLQKATLAVGVVAMSVGLFNSFNAEANEGCGCSYDIAGVEFPCTRIWCQSTWSLSACGLGDVASQECNEFKEC